MDLIWTGRFHPRRYSWYSPNGTLLWEAFARLATVWGAALPNGDVCATGGYDALITCWTFLGGEVTGGLLLVGYLLLVLAALSARAMDRGRSN